MSDYIERGALMDKIGDRLAYLRKEYGDYDHYTDGYEECYCRVEEAQAEDVVRVRHERWDDSGRYTFLNGKPAVRCTGCGACLAEEEYKKNVWNFCSVCGAKMDGGDDDAID